ncbi:hypothetical protein [Aquifex aeolicus]|uniref:hypothetical protein n=1 Tax=Aquifex aeolicus TaxID=63363 RepID=UPI0002DD7EC9|nr:hypothetical protein [Aquifex aeolicus]
MEDFEKILLELENDNVRHLPYYLCRDILSEVKFYLENGSVELKKVEELLYLLSLNPMAREEVGEILRDFLLR